MSNYTTKSNKEVKNLSEYKVKQLKKQMLELRKQKNSSEINYADYTQKALSLECCTQVEFSVASMHGWIFDKANSSYNVINKKIFTDIVQVLVIIEFLICRDIYKKLGVDSEFLHIKDTTERTVNTILGKIVIKVPRSNLSGLLNHILKKIKNTFSMQLNESFQIQRGLGLTPNDIRTYHKDLYNTTHSVSFIQGIINKEIVNYEQFISKRFKDKYKILHIDGKWVNTDGNKNKNVILVITGITDKGYKKILYYKSFESESLVNMNEALNDLYTRGIKNVRLVICDSSTSITSAVENRYPDTEIQHCYFHVLSNLKSLTTNKHDKDKMIGLVNSLFSTRNEEEFDKALSKLFESFPELKSKIIKRLSDKYTFTFVKYHESIAKYIKTNNVAEGINQKISITISHSKYYRSNESMGAALYRLVTKANKKQLNPIESDLIAKLESVDSRYFDTLQNRIKTEYSLSIDYIKITIDREYRKDHFYIDKSILNKAIRYLTKKASYIK